MEPLVQVDSYTKSRLPAAHPETPRTDPEQTQNSQTTPPWGHLGPSWTTALRDQQTRRPSRLQRLQLAWHCSFFFPSLFPRHVVYCAVLYRAEGQDVSLVTSLDADKLQASLYTIVRHCSSYELTHPSQGILSCCACRREWDGRLGLRRLWANVSLLCWASRGLGRVVADDIVFGDRVPSPGQPAKVQP